MRGESEVFLYFPRREAYLRFGASQGLVETRGPQTVPVEGRGQERLDLRVHRIDPHDRAFWPFPDAPVVVDESSRPPGPGEEQAAPSGDDAAVTLNELRRHLRALGSPAVSAVVALPLRKDGGAARFGLDLAPHLARAAGAGTPGTFLVGIRRLDRSTERAWMRVQATDLALTTVEETGAVRFAVTSLASAAPAAGATVAVEVLRGDQLEVARGTTDAAGIFVWTGPEAARRKAGGGRLRRIVVSRGDDVLVLDPAQAGERYADNAWLDAKGEGWLDWLINPAPDEHAPEPPARLCHVFTERPVYRPEETVHVKGWLRRRQAGRLEVLGGDGYAVVVEGPGDKAWRYPVTFTAAGGFHHAFTEPDLPTGPYSAHLEAKDGERLGLVSFRLEAYRLPRFEVRLAAPDRVPLDREFEVELDAAYYAGGAVAGQKVQWRVTQFPHAWTPERRPGFAYSSDARYARSTRFESTPRLEREDATDGHGAARLVLNPAVEPTAQPRSYVVEATVTGSDDQTVTATRQVIALPAFVLGLKAPRFLERAGAIAPEVAVVGPDGKGLAGVDVQVTLLSRQWHSHLRASDFSDGVARYVTEVVDEKVTTRHVTSAAEPVPVPFTLDRAGVYVIEIEAHDRLDRAQVVSVDLFAGGDEPIAWSKPESRVFTVASDKAAYDPGESAQLVVESPWQSARALVVVEAPEGNRYHWLDVQGGNATFRLPVLKTWVPRVPVHFVLLRGRLPGSAAASDGVDLGRPLTMAATTWLAVNPVENRVETRVSLPERARPGETIEVEVRLSDRQGRPLAGEVTLWLVDQAVLALGREQRLDPLPDFITDVRSRLEARDTRSLTFGLVPFAESPGGDEASREEPSLLDRTTVRKLFQAVPFYDPAVAVGPEGVARVRVKLSDDLTNFLVRAKAASGPDRFGFATGKVQVRLPLLVQPALPRFVRPGDAFAAAAIGRVVEGEGGPGSAEMAATGLALASAPRREVAWAPDRPERIAFDVTVPTPGYDAEGRLERDEVTLRFGVERRSDGARDAFEARLPIRPDRRRVVRRLLADLEPGQTLELPGAEEEARPGTLRRTVLAAEERGIVRLAAGLDFLLEYPYGCTEQRLSRARASIGLGSLRERLHQGGASGLAGGDLERMVNETVAWIAGAVDGQGLVAYWPGANGYVSLTAWSLDFLTEAEKGKKLGPDGAALAQRLARTLEQALRSDYGRFIDGESWSERSFALGALARKGSLDPAYAAELLRRAGSLPLEARAEVLLAFQQGSDARSPAVRAVARDLWDGVTFRLHQGKTIYGGLADLASPRNALILPSETRTLAAVTRALGRAEAGEASSEERVQRLVDALVTLGQGDGWGTTNANAAAMLALAERLGGNAGSSRPERTLEVRFAAGPGPAPGSTTRNLVLGGGTPVAWLASAAPGKAELSLPGSGGPVAVRAELGYVPLADGSQAAPRAAGFVVGRELLIVAADGAAPERVRLEEPGRSVPLAVGQVVEDHVQVVNPKERHYVAVVVPLAAGMEPLNPELATAPPEARPQGPITLDPTYAAYLDDHVAFYYDTLPAGTFDFHFRTRAAVAGSFIQPAAWAEMMYDGAVQGESAGARLVISRPPGE